MSQPNSYLTFLMGRRAGMQATRYTWWQHWRDLADYFLPRRYRWFVSPNSADRGGQINQQILDSSGCLAAGKLAAGLMSGKVSPISQWFGLGVDDDTSAGENAVSIWLADCEKRMRRVFAESNFYPSTAQWIYDLVIFGTSTQIIYEDYDTVINCMNPCAGEFYVDLDGKFRPTILYREFTMTIGALVGEFGIENVSDSSRRAFEAASGGDLTREVIVCHAIEPNTDGKDFGVSSRFAFREAYWELGGSQSPQAVPTGFLLRLRGFHEQPHATTRWDIMGNDAYGRSPAMDALPDQRQLQLETKRKAQAIDKKVNPPMLADARLKGQPATQLPGGITYIDGMMASQKVGFESLYKMDFDLEHVTKDLEEIRERLHIVFFNDIVAPISQFQTRSNVTAIEINQRKAEALIMLGPVFERLDNEGLRPIVERVWGIMSRSGCFAPAPSEIQGKEVQVKFVSMLTQAQDANTAASIAQVLGLVGNVIGVDPALGDKLDFDKAIDIYSRLLNNDPRIIRSDDATAKIRADRAQQQQEAARAEQAQQIAMSAKNLAQAPVGQGSALDALTGGR